MFDGDTVFCLATGRRPLPAAAGFFDGAQAQSVSAIGHAAADCTARAIIHAVLRARTLAGITAFGELPELGDAAAGHR
jgi:L-aminopeptidase/D-esterase-like protein